MSNDKAQSSNEFQKPNGLKEDFDINPFDRNVPRKPRLACLPVGR
jgi:hypothetical protein